MSTTDRASVSRTVAWAKRQSVRAGAADYLRYVTALIESIDLYQVEAVVNALCRARDTGSRVYIIGNGGSAATASHFATDLANMSKRGVGKPLRVLSLADNTAWMTALANDTGYDNVFAGQLENLAEPGDILIAISASGNSQCLVTAVELARARTLTTIGLLGFGGGALLELVDIAIHIRSVPGLYGPVEDVHLILQHIVSSCLASA